jgi:phenylacetate-CoA ligase
MERQRIDPRETSLQIGIFGAEPWTNDMRAHIEARAAIDAVDIYGLSEVIGPGVAQECVETKDGLTVWEDHFYPEIVDPESGAALPDGELGELVFTSLTKEALPVIRYRTRDLTRLLPGTARPMRRIEKIAGRSDDMLIVRGVNVFPSQIEELILRDPSLAPHYKIVVERAGNLDEVTVSVEPADVAANETASARLRERIKTFVGISVTIEMLPRGSIEPSAGKARRVFDRRKTESGQVLSPSAPR